MAGWIRKAASGRYQARYRIPGGRTRSRTFERHKDADRWLRHEVALIDRSDWIDPHAGTMTIAEWSDRWMAIRLHIRDSTRERDETYLRSLILPHFGTRRLRDITRDDIQDWIGELAGEGYAPANHPTRYGLVPMAFVAAVDDALIQRTPCAGVDLPRRTQTEKRLPTVVTSPSMAKAGLDMTALSSYPTLRMPVPTTTNMTKRLGCSTLRSRIISGSDNRDHEREDCSRGNTHVR